MCQLIGALFHQKQFSVKFRKWTLQMWLFKKILSCTNWPTFQQNHILLIFTRFSSKITQFSILHPLPPTELHLLRPNRGEAVKRKNFCICTVAGFPLPRKLILIFSDWSTWKFFVPITLSTKQGHRVMLLQGLCHFQQWESPQWNRNWPGGNLLLPPRLCLHRWQLLKWAQFPHR